MGAILRCATLAGLLLVGVACGYADRPTAPSAVLPPVTVQPPPPVPPTLEVPAGSQRYDFSAPLTHAVASYTITSRYVLGPGRNFALQYTSLSGQYAGTFQQDGNRISFRFAGDSRWEAVGTLNGDSLTVEYNLDMQMSDFDNAVYRRVP
jgi:hypothetical protein